MKKRVLVIGGGFAGINACQTLAKSQDIDVTLVDQNERFVFTPWLIDALSGSKSVNEISFDYEAFAKQHNIRFVRGTLKHIDRVKRLTTITTTQGDTIESYDDAMLTIGAKTAYYGIPGATHYTHALKQLDDVETLHRSIKKHIAKSLESHDTLTKQAYASFAVIGAGPAGIESAFAIKRYVMSMYGADWCRIAPYVRFSIIQGSPTILPGFSSKAISLATDELKRQGFDLYLGEPVESINSHLIKTTKGTTIHAATILWCAGVESHPLEITPPLPVERGGFLAESDTRLEAHLYAAGDDIRYVQGTTPLPKTAQVAMPMGKHSALSLLRATTQTFSFTFKGSVLTLGTTGVFDMTWLKKKTRIAKLVRELMYRFRFWQLQQ